MPGWSCTNGYEAVPGGAPKAPGGVRSDADAGRRLAVPPQRRFRRVRPLAVCLAGRLLRRGRARPAYRHSHARRGHSAPGPSPVVNDHTGPLVRPLSFIASTRQ